MIDMDQVTEKKSVELGVGHRCMISPTLSQRTGFIPHLLVSPTAKNR